MRDITTNKDRAVQEAVAQDGAKVKLTPTQARRMRRKKLAASYKENIAEPSPNIVSNIPQGQRPGHTYYPYGIQDIAAECRPKAAKKELNNELSDKASATSDSVANQNNFFALKQGVATQQSLVPILEDRFAHTDNSQSRRPWHIYNPYNAVQIVSIKQNKQEIEVSSTGLRERGLSKRNYNNRHNKWRDRKQWVAKQLKDNVAPENYPPHP